MEHYASATYSSKCLSGIVTTSVTHAKRLKDTAVLSLSICALLIALAVGIGGASIRHFSLHALHDAESAHHLIVSSGEPQPFPPDVPQC